MARISDTLVVQLVDDRLVIVDDATGHETIVRADEQDGFIAACLYLHGHAVVHEPCKAAWSQEQWAMAAQGGA